MKPNLLPAPWLEGLLTAIGTLLSSSFCWQYASLGRSLGCPSLPPQAGGQYEEEAGWVEFLHTQ